jgi:hypothetical protein
MATTIDFVGLVYFHDAGDNRRFVLLPDGTAPDNPRILPHVAAVDIASNDLIAAANWPQASPPAGSGGNPSLHFPITASAKLTISGTIGNGVDTTAHDGRLPSLGAMGLQVSVSASKTIARLTISNGTLTAREMSTGDPNVRGAIVSQLTIPENGDVRIRAAEKNGTVRQLIVRGGSEIVISNVSAGLDDLNAPPADGHYQIFRTLASPTRRNQLQPPVPSARKSPAFTSTHPFFFKPANHPSLPCSNTCCA